MGGSKSHNRASEGGEEVKSETAKSVPGFTGSGGVEEEVRDGLEVEPAGEGVHMEDLFGDGDNSSGGFLDLSVLAFFRLLFTALAVLCTLIIIFFCVIIITIVGGG